MSPNDLFRNLLITGGIAAVVIIVVYRNQQKIRSHIVPVMTYKEAIGYLAENQTLDERIRKGAMYRTPHPHGFLFTQVFLDETNNPVVKPNGNPYGRKLVVGRFDDELSDAFGSKDVVIVE